jgi:LysR family transcriptional regulator, cyn operon transcriptional activator
VPVGVASTNDFTSISFRDLRIFLALAQRRSMTTAAKDVYMTQSGMSRAIQALEATVGAQLFTRSRQGLALTDAGAAFKVYAQRLAESYVAVVTGVQTARDKRITLAASNVIAPLILPGLLQHQPLAKVVGSLVLDELPSHIVMAKVATGTADLGLSMCADTTLQSGVDVMPLLRAPLGLLAGAAARLPAVIPSIGGLLQLPGVQLARLADDMVLPHALRAYSLQHGVAFDAYFASRLVSNSIPALFSAIAGGRLSTLVSAIAAHSAQQPLQFLPLPHLLPTLQLCLVGRKGSNWRQLHAPWVDAIVASVQSAAWPTSVVRL